MNKIYFKIICSILFEIGAFFSGVILIFTFEYGIEIILIYLLLMQMFNNIIQYLSEKEKKLKKENNK